MFEGKSIAGVSVYRCLKSVRDHGRKVRAIQPGAHRRLVWGRLALVDPFPSLFFPLRQTLPLVCIVVAVCLPTSMKCS